ncbi:Protein of unknown function [Gryllus bimaculatus]|nr:Protein of unknown function [Gryllus bimaculatus]
MRVRYFQCSVDMFILRRCDCAWLSCSCLLYMVTSNERTAEFLLRRRTPRIVQQKRKNAL